MSFSFEFVAKPAEVPEILVKNPSAAYAPEVVKEFVRMAVSGLKNELVSIKVSGHLYNFSNKNDYQVSTVNIEVKPLVVESVSV